jgi:ATP-binding cassette subfamily C protein CydCD
LPAGLETQLGEHAARVSGGERQRLALARALLRDFPVLILDEPTEHLERSTAVPLLNDLLTALSGRSLLLITHELDRLEDFDEIIVLDRGRVVERGTHAQLVAAGGRFTDARLSKPSRDRGRTRGEGARGARTSRLQALS